MPETTLFTPRGSLTTHTRVACDAVHEKSARRTFRDAQCLIVKDDITYDIGF